MHTLRYVSTNAIAYVRCTLHVSYAYIKVRLAPTYENSSSTLVYAE